MRRRVCHSERRGASSLYSATSRRKSGATQRGSGAEPPRFFASEYVCYGSARQGTVLGAAGDNEWLRMTEERRPFVCHSERRKASSQHRSSSRRNLGWWGSRPRSEVRGGAYQ